MAPFQENIKKLRLDKKMSLEQLAQVFSERYESKISKSSISRWENGQANPDIEDANLYADYFNVSLDWLMDRKPVQSQNDDILLAAHIDDDATEEEKEEIRKYFEYLKSRRK